MVTDYEATLSNDTDTVDILLTKPLKHNFDKQIQQLPIPKQTPTLTYLIDLKKLIQIIEVNGVLEDETAQSSLAKKVILETMLASAKSFTLAWGTGAKAQSYTGDIVKSEIRELAGRVGDEGSQNKTFEVMLQFGVGKFRG